MRSINIANMISTNLDLQANAGIVELRSADSTHRFYHTAWPVAAPATCRQTAGSGSHGGRFLGSEQRVTESKKMRPVGLPGGLVMPAVGVLGPIG